MDNFVIIGTKLETKSFDKQIEELERQLKNIEEELSDPKKYKLDSRSIQEYQVKAEKLKNSIISLKKQQLKLNENNFFQNAANSISGLIKKTLKWGVALFGIRSAYNFISKSMNTLSQYNEQISTDLSYIKFAIATSLEKFIEDIIQLVYKLLKIINNISVALFNVNLFANASADRFKSMGKSAKEIKKNLAGFDEMNVMQDNSTDSGIGTPSIDLSANVNEYKETGEQFKSFWEGIIQFWEEGWYDAFNSVEGNWGLFSISLGLFGKGAFDVFKGLFDSLVGLSLILIGIFTGDQETLEKGWNLLIKGLKEMAIGLVEGIIGLAGILLGSVLGIFLDLVQGIYKTVIEPIANNFTKLWNGIFGGVNWVVNSIILFFLKIPLTIIGIIATILSLFGEFGTKAGQAISSTFISAINTALSIIENILNAPIKAINKLIGVINKVPGINLETLSTFKLPRLAKGGIINMPGRGVNYGGANIAERGAEGVIPLTDAQQMRILGEAIGKFITVNTTVVNSMNGRVISRELQKVQNEDNFSFNR